MTGQGLPHPPATLELSHMYPGIKHPPKSSAAPQDMMSIMHIDDRLEMHEMMMNRPHAKKGTKNTKIMNE